MKWDMAVCQNLVPRVNPKIAVHPTKNVSIGIDPYPYVIRHQSVGDTQPCIINICQPGVQH